MANVINIGGGAGGGGGDASKRELTWAEYQALTEAEKNNGTMYFCNDVNGDGSEFQPVIYSEEEREIGVWLDGKPLYQKTINDTFTNSASLLIDITSLSVGALVAIKGILFASDTTTQLVIDEDSAGGVQFTGANQHAITIGRNSASSYGNTPTVYVTLRYTKTTDQAGSGTWTPQGVPAQHYSTNEHIVGTWIDGSTLYEKTVSVSGLTLSDNATTDITITDYISDFGYAISLETVCVAQNQQYLTLPYYVGGQYVIEAFFNGATTLSVYRNGGQITVDMYFTIRYTKSTT